MSAPSQKIFIKHLKHRCQHYRIVIQKKTNEIKLQLGHPVHCVFRIGDACGLRIRDLFVQANDHHKFGCIYSHQQLT